MLRTCAVPAGVRDRVEGVGDRDDARAQRNAPALEVPGVAGAVPSLVMRQHALGKIGIEMLQRREDVGAAPGVRHHRAPFRRREPGVVVKDVGDRLVDLADVVEQCDALDAVTRALVHVGRIGENQRIVGDAPDVGAGDGVVGVDGVEQRLERGGAEPLGVLARAAFANHQSAGEEADTERGQFGHRAASSCARNVRPLTLNWASDA